MLQSSVKKMRDLRYKNLVFLLSGMSEHLKKEVADLECLEDWTAPQKQDLFLAMLEFATNTEGNAGLPIEYEGWRNMDTLCSMFKARYEQYESRLEDWTVGAVELWLLPAV